MFVSKIVPRRGVAALALLVTSLVCAPSVAQPRAPVHAPTPAEEAQAEELFQRARLKALQRDFEAACELFEESYRLAGGGGTLQNLAICYEDGGKRLALAHQKFVELRRLSVEAGRQDRVKLADEHITKLELRLARLRVRVPVASRVPGLKITVDGEEPNETTREAGVLVDVGTHVVKVSAPAKQAIEIQKLISREGAVEILEVPVLAELPREAGGKGATPPPSASERAAARDGTRTVGYATGATGLAVLVAGGVFGVLTITTNNAAKRACQDTTPGLSLSNTRGDDPTRYFDASGSCYASTAERPNPFVEAANRVHAEARTYGTISTILVPVGLIAAGVGAYLVLTSSSDEGPRQSSAPLRARVSAGLGGLSLSGEFQ